MHWQRVWTVYCTPVMTTQPSTKTRRVMGYHTIPAHMTMLCLKSIVVISGSKAVLRWKFHRLCDCPSQAIYGRQVSLRTTQRQQTSQTISG